MSRAAVVDRLRQQIRALERTPAFSGPGMTATTGRPSGRSWSFGIGTVDAAVAAPGSLPGLDVTSVHEVKPVAAADTTAPAAACRVAALGFALALAARLDAGGRDVGGGPDGKAAHPASAGPILWCAAPPHRHELGRCYGPGLAAFGLDPARLLVVEAARADDTLWALEEGLASGAIALAVGFLDAVPPTPARRLTLAAAASGTPCLVITHPARPPALTAATRWRVAPALSGPHPFDRASPGAPRLAVRLERCRARPLALADRTIHMEWCDATFRFRLAAGSRDRTLRPHLAAARTG